MTDWRGDFDIGQVYDQYTEKGIRKLWPSTHLVYRRAFGIGIGLYVGSDEDIWVTTEVYYGRKPTMRKFKFLA